MVLVGVMVFKLKAAHLYGFLLISTGIILFSTWNTFFNSFLMNELELKEGSLRWKNWKETPVPMYMDVYLFNWTNPTRLKKTKPHLTELGPYRFHEKRTKVDVVWNSNKTVSFRQVRRWTFDAESSVGSLKDNVTTVNVIALITAYLTRFQTYFDQKALSFTLVTLRQAISVTKSVEELLFNGYQDDLLTLANHLPDSLKNSARTRDRFGWFYKRNGSSEEDGYFNMETGAGNLSRIGQVRQWNYSNKTTFMGSNCQQGVTGVSGELWPPKASKYTSLSIFSPDSCRTVELNYQREMDVQRINTHLYSGDADMFTEREACSPSSPRGLLNLTACRWGAPLYLSYPHFLHADPKVQQGVTGLKPDADSHTFSIALEPTFGMPLDLKARFQINMMLERLDSYRIYKDIPERVFIPVMWIDQRAYITPTQAWLLWSLQKLPCWGILFSASLVVLGAALILNDLRKRRCPQTIRVLHI